MSDTRATASKAFLWSGVDANGNRVKNQRVVAPTQEAVVSALQREGALPTSVKSAAGMQGINLNMQIGGGTVKFKWAAKADFARRLYQMLRAGISVPRALISLGEDAKPNIAAMCQDLSDKVSSGQQLSAAMRAYPKAFDDVFCAYVAAGEESGTLLTTMERLSLLVAKRASMQSKIKGVMAYPKMVGGTIGILVFGIIMFLVPQYEKIYASFHAELPAPTMFIVNVSRNMSPIVLSFPFIRPFSIGAVIAYIVIGVIIFKRQTKDNEDVQIFINKVRFRMPLFGKLNHKSSLFRWASTLGGSLNSGVQSTRAIELAAAASASPWQQSLAPVFVEAIRSGRTMSQEMAKYPDLYPNNIRTMMSTGEVTGEIDEMLLTVSVTLDEDIDSIIAGLSAKIEVALLLVLGVVVGGLLIVLYLPILNLAATASKGLGG